MKKYGIKIGKRFISWVDEHWYETQKENMAIFDSIISVKEAIKQLSNHYVYNPIVCEFDGDTCKEVNLYKEPNPNSYFVTNAKPLKIKAKIKF